MIICADHLITGDGKTVLENQAVMAGENGQKEMNDYQYYVN